MLTNCLQGDYYAALQGVSQIDLATAVRKFLNSDGIIDDVEPVKESSDQIGSTLGKRYVGRERLHIFAGHSRTRPYRA